VWDLTTDPFSHTQLAENWDLVDLLIGTAPDSIALMATVPVSGNFAGRVIMLTATDSGFPAWTILRYDGSVWKTVGPLEVLPAIPTLGNYEGRVVILSSASGGFAAWSMIGYNGSSWGVIGGFGTVNTGGGALNILGMSTGEDVYFTSATRGPVMVDRNTGLKYRLYISDGKLLHEVVS
jgi:hypothetical protein